MVGSSGRSGILADTSEAVETFVVHMIVVHMFVVHMVGYFQTAGLLVGTVALVFVGDSLFGGGFRVSGIPFGVGTRHFHVLPFQYVLDVCRGLPVESYTPRLCALMLGV